jgi:hypothetical protein
LSSSSPPGSSVRFEEEPNDYLVLGVAHDADVADVRKAFRGLSLRLHPDKHGGVTTPRYARALAAFERLTDPATRAAFDAGAGLLASFADPGAAAAATAYGLDAPPGLGDEVNERCVRVGCGLKRIAKPAVLLLVVSLAASEHYCMFDLSFFLLIALPPRPLSRYWPDAVPFHPYGDPLARGAPVHLLARRNRLRAEAAASSLAAWHEAFPDPDLSLLLPAAP